MSRHFQRGFTLVELMVAMVIGLIVLLGAGQLYVTLRQNQQRAEDIAARQDLLLFVSSRLLHEVRISKRAEVLPDGSLYLEFISDDPKVKTYCFRQGASNDLGKVEMFEVEKNCEESADTGGGLELASGICDFFTKISGVTSVELTFVLPASGNASRDRCMQGEGEALVFNAVSRNQVLQRWNGNGVSP